MEFVIKKKDKENVEKLVASKKTSVRIIRIIEKIVLIIALVFGLGFIIYNIVHPEAYFNKLKGEKEYSLILSIGIIRMLGCLTAWFLIVTLRKVISAVGTGDRVDETLSIQGDSLEEKCLFYTYRIIHQSLPTEMGLVAIFLNEIENIRYNSELKKITIQGRMFDTWLNNVEVLDEVDISKREEGKFIIFDYFSPSLIEELKKYPIKIN